MLIQRAMDADEKLALLTDDSRYDLSCACGTKTGTDHRTRGSDGLWVYPTTLPRGGDQVMLKTLLSNGCANDCRYCPLRRDGAARRCTLTPDELARAFMGYLRTGQIFGLFLTSGVIRDADHTMDRMTSAVRILRRKYGFRGYVHMKIIPGASDAAIREALALSSAVSLNVEAPTRARFRALSDAKDFDRDIVAPMRLISSLTARGCRFSRVKQTTQFVVGASDETDTEIVEATFGLYRRLKLNRIYYSAYQRGLGDPDLPGEQRVPGDPGDVLTREHRLYQVDWLLRKYGFDADEIPFESDGNLSLETDPKELWAVQHPEFFPLDMNRAKRRELLRVPGFGPETVRRIMSIRKEGGRVRRLGQLGKVGKRLSKSAAYVRLT
jgi:predicted DNA-binding helix-hairpin-helix protein